MNKIQFVIIGVGRIGTKYSKIISENSNAELIAAVDTDFSKRKSINTLVPFFKQILFVYVHPMVCILHTPFSF
jgi:UDP-N-acetyl-2-amino-2-deoxyglucuronate dehydrogenase